MEDKEYVGIHLVANERLKPEYRIASDDIAIIRFYKNSQFGLKATIKPFKEVDMFGGEMTEKDKKAYTKRSALLDKREEAYKKAHGGRDMPTNSSHWKRVDDYSRKVQMAICMMMEEMLQSQEERNIYIGRRQALSWDIHQTQPNWWKSDVVSWADIGDVSDESLQGVISQLGGSQGHPLILAWTINKTDKQIDEDHKKLKTMFGGIFKDGVSYETFQIYRKELAKQMIEIEKG